MGAGGMSEITIYRLRAESGDALWEALAGASAGKARPYVWEDAPGARHFDEARVRLPYAELTAGEPVETTDPDTGEIVETIPSTPTGFWLCDVVLVDESDAGLAALAAAVDQAASG
ncbi:MAG TPA: hypothetical protein VF449_09380 [Parvibaculum sp.]